MKVRLMLILWFGLGILGLRSVHGSALQRFFPDLVKDSEIIAEGKVIEQTQVNRDVKWTENICRKISVFKVSRVYKGDIRAGETVTVLSDFDSLCNTSRLEKGVSYLLMLKHRPEGYVDVNSGQGTYHIVDLGENRLAVVCSGSSIGDAKLLEQFRTDLAWTMNAPKTAASQPAVTKEAAREIARKNLANTGIDLENYKEREVKLFKYSPTNIGFAYEGDWVWFFDWEVPGIQKKNPRPSDSFVFCYVNGQTGKVICGPQRMKSGLSFQDRCRAFLATYDPCRKTYRGVVRQMKFRYVTEEEATGLFSQARNLFFPSKKEYPEGTCFLYGEFPAVTKLQPVLFVLNSEGDIEFAGVIQNAKR